MDALTGSAWGQLGFAAIVLVAALSIVTGRIVPKATLDRMIIEHGNEVERLIAGHREAIEDWKAAVALREEGNRELLKQQHRLLEIAYLAKNVGVRIDEATSDAPT